MIPKECRRLIEMDFPIGAVSVHAVREKSIRYGHPSTLHLLVGSATACRLPGSAPGASLARPLRSALPFRV